MISHKPSDLIAASFIRKLNRFVGVVTIGNETEEVYIPNTGRLGELLLPGSTVFLQKYEGKFRYKLLFVEYGEYPVLIDSIKTNRIVKDLITEKKVPGLEDHTLVSSEPSVGNQRFDFLLANDRGEWEFVEIKSCTLAWENVASFPDAVSSRAAHHVETLAGHNNSHLIFIVFHPTAKVFIPNYHTDFIFYSVLASLKKYLSVQAFTVSYNSRWDVDSLQEIPVELPPVEDRGSVLAVFSDGKRFFLTGIEAEEKLMAAEKRLKKIEINGTVYPIDKKFPVRMKSLEECLSTFKEKMERVSERGDMISFEHDPLTERRFWNTLFELRYEEIARNYR